MTMLQANLQDTDFSEPIEFSLDELGGELGYCGYSCMKSKASSAVSYVADKTVDAAKASYSGVKTAGAYVADKVCGAAMDPKVQAAAIAASYVPEPYTKGAAAGVQVTGAACSVFYPPSLPAYGGPPVNNTALQVPMMYASPVLNFRTSGSQASQGSPVTPAVPPGTIAAFDPKRGAYRVAVPGLPGFSAPAAFTEVNSQATKPAGAQLVALKTFETQTGTAKPWFKNPLVLGGIAAGVLVVGGGGYMLMRG